MLEHNERKCSVENHNSYFHYYIMSLGKLFSSAAHFTFFRALMFVSNNFDGTIQMMDLTADDLNILALINRELHTYIDNMEEAKYDRLIYLLQI